MRFMIIRKADEETESGVMPDEEQMTRVLTDMGNYNEELLRAGILRGGDGLLPSSEGTRVLFSGGKTTVIDGPFAESRELIAGFTLIEVDSKEEALEWVKRWPASDGNGSVRLELRQIFEDDDFGEEFTPELREQEARMRAQIADRQ